jgi:hypothetical protein
LISLKSNKKCVIRYTTRIRSVILSIKKRFQQIIRFLAVQESGVSFIDVKTDYPFDKGDTGETRAKNLILSFLRLLSGTDIPGFKESRDCLKNIAGPDQERAAIFFSSAFELIFEEIEAAYQRDPDFREDFDGLYDSVTEGTLLSDADAAQNKIWGLFFPEGASALKPAEHIALLREKRRVRITLLNNDPVSSPGREVLFTSNALFTTGPGSATGAAETGDRIANELWSGEDGEQIYWYDHPIPVGIEPERNELLHGIRNLSRALEFEERTGAKEPGRNIDFVLSVSATHPGLNRVARKWIESEISRAGGAPGINLYVFTEDDTVRIMDEILIPAVERFMEKRETGPLREVFGVDGEYGRHYSFLKAIARFWSVLVSPEIRATFKIDLDQAFPQEELAAHTGLSAFRHLSTSLWGAQGIDSGGNRVYLGMIAGGLVNRRDIGSSLFHPDVKLPEGDPSYDERIFRSAVPQAVSTEAEMMTRYGPGMPFDGTATCIQRVHVTGGTNGILVEALRRYRPFALSHTGRAEDQAYLLSILFTPSDREFLRYVHEPGLIMRHDADLFAGEMTRRERNGTIIGDYIRTLFFSLYAAVLPWPAGSIKDAVDPFTGCFISRIPVTLVCLRFCFKALSLLCSSGTGDGMHFFHEGVSRLSPMIGDFRLQAGFFRETYEREKRGWDLYYDILDALERKIGDGDLYAIRLRDKAGDIIRNLRLGI